MKNTDILTDVEISHQNDKKELLKEFLIFFFGATGLVLITAATIGLTNLAFKQIPEADKGFFFPLNGWLANFLTAASIWLVIGITLLFLRKYIIEFVFKQSRVFENLVIKMEGTESRSGLMPRFEEGVDGIENELDRLKKLLTQEELLRKGLLLYSENTSGILSGFLDEDINCSPEFLKEVRIVATAKGLIGPKSFWLGKHIIDFIKNWHKVHPTDQIPFETFYIVIPDNRLAGNKEHRGYHFFIKYFILDIVKYILEIYSGSTIQPIIFKIRYIKTPDIFPAWHIWGERRVIVVPSISYKENYNLADTFPIGFVISETVVKNELRNKIPSTIKRLICHFDNNVFTKDNDINDIETWTLENGNIIITNFNKGVLGDLSEFKEYYHNKNEILTKFNTKFGIEATQNSLTILGNEIPEIMEMVKQLGNIEVNG
jgi:hypothetical protein